MKRIFLYFCLLILSCGVSAQEKNLLNDSTILNESKVSVDSLLSGLANTVEYIAYQQSNMDENRGRYKIYKTENMYNLLKLDTATGIIEQIQWSLKENEEFTVVVNYQILSYSGKIGRFELYPTNNMYQFILLDTTDGRTWHVQWGTEPQKRWIKRII